MTVKRIVLVLPDPPMPFGSAAARWYYVLLRGLVERGHDVTTFAACVRSQDIPRVQELFPTPDYNLRLFPHSSGGSALRRKWNTLRRPYSYVFSSDLQQHLRTRLTSPFDVLHLEQVWSGWLGLAHVNRALLNVHYLVDIDLARARAASLAERVRRFLVRRAERRLLTQYRHIATLTPRLSTRVRELSPRSHVHTVPLGFDLTQYRFAPREDHRATDHAPTVGLIGSFNWEPTLSAARRLLTRLWPEISRRVPTARLQLVGREAEHALESFAGMEGVTIVENVPDIMPHFDSTDVMLYAPAQGSGMKVKVLEAFALGVPVVTNRDGTEGLPVEDGVHADVTDDDDALVDRTVALLDDQQLRTRRAAAARSLVEQHCNPSRVIDRLEAVYRSLEQGG